MASEPMIFHWDPEDDRDGNRWHVFEGHDVEPDEVEQFIEDYLDVRGACIHRFTVMTTHTRSWRPVVPAGRS